MKGGIKLSDLKYQIIKEVGDITQNKKVRNKYSENVNFDVFCILKVCRGNLSI